MIRRAHLHSMFDKYNAKKESLNRRQRMYNVVNILDYFLLYYRQILESDTGVFDERFTPLISMAAKRIHGFLFVDKLDVYVQLRRFNRLFPRHMHCLKCIKKK